MNYIDKALQSFNNFKGYTGSQPKNETEYNELLNDNSKFISDFNGVFEGTAPTWSEVNAKIQELKDAETAHTNARTTGKAKLKSGEALTDAEIKALFGDN